MLSYFIKTVKARISNVQVRIGQNDLDIYRTAHDWKFHERRIIPQHISDEKGDCMGCSTVALPCKMLLSDSQALVSTDHTAPAMLPCHSYVCKSPAFKILLHIPRLTKRFTTNRYQYNKNLLHQWSSELDSKDTRSNFINRGSNPCFSCKALHQTWTRIRSHEHRFYPNLSWRRHCYIFGNASNFPPTHTK